MTVAINNKYHYVPQAPCRNGHYLRYIRNDACVECADRKRPKKRRAYFRCDYSQYPSEPCWNAVCIPLTFGHHALIDAEDFDALYKYKWATRPQKAHRYATRSDRIDGRMIKRIMHREIFKTDEPHIDHINGNGLDNRKVNLRGCNHSQNQGNRPKTVKSASKYKGVTKRGELWLAICAKKHAGTFKTEIEAARAYDVAAIERWGEFARINFPEKR